MHPNLEQDSCRQHKYPHHTKFNHRWWKEVIQTIKTDTLLLLLIDEYLNPKSLAMANENEKINLSVNNLLVVGT